MAQQLPNSSGMAPPADPLAQLRDIHMPTTLDIWPPAPGWWLLAALALCALVGTVWWIYRRWRDNRYRREALSELARLKTDFDEHQDVARYLEAYSALLKRTALTGFPRPVVASLTGERWARFLDQTADTSEFSMGAGQALISGSYAPAPAAEIERLQELGELWIRHHDPRRVDTDPAAREVAA